MKKIFFLFLTLLVSVSLLARDKEPIWPKNKMPYAQDHQIAAMTNESSDKNFKADKNRIAYIEWFEAPPKDKRQDACMVLISGGSYECCCDVGLINQWKETFTKMGIQCVNLVYRTPRPKDMAIYQTAWADGQRAIRMIRKQAKERGFNPEKIGVISMSAGSHLALLLGTSSLTPAYEHIDALDTIPCHINWAIINAPAYGTTDAELGTLATRQGYGPDVTLSKVFQFDQRTCPMSLHHGAIDIYAPQTSTLVYRQLRRMRIPADLHLYPHKGHGAYGLERGIEFMRQMGFIDTLAKEEFILDRYATDDTPCDYSKASIWPDGKTPDFQENQNEPYIEWYIPKELKTKAIQIVYAGGAYEYNRPEDHEVAPIRRYLNAKGMAVVVLKYRSPRPKAPLAKHTTAWQDLQRTVRIVRKEAESRGLDPNRIGIMGSSAGGHLTLMGTTSSMHRSYLPIDKIDDIPCNVQWGICIYPAYVLSDGINGTNARGGNDDNVTFAPDFSFDLKSAPMIFMHGDSDPYAAMNSVKSWERLLAMGVQCELHSFAKRNHCFHRNASPNTGSYNCFDIIWEYLTNMGVNK